MSSITVEEFARKVDEGYYSALDVAPEVIDPDEKQDQSIGSPLDNAYMEVFNERQEEAGRDFASVLEHVLKVPEEERKALVYLTHESAIDYGEFEHSTLDVMTLILRSIDKAIKANSVNKETKSAETSEQYSSSSLSV